MVSSISFVIAFRHFIHGQLQWVDGITLSFKQRHRAQIDGRAPLVREPNRWLHLANANEVSQGN